jgi:uncharacterized membrane protein YkvA (DUF1232 family)
LSWPVTRRKRGNDPDEEGHHEVGVGALTASIQGDWMFCREYWRQRVRTLTQSSYALYLAARDPRVPWYAKAVVALVVGYAFSPIDLIPDFIPVLGYLDDLLLLPLGIALAIRLIPPAVWRDCLARAEARQAKGEPRSWFAAAVIIAVWLVVLGLVARAVR